MSSATLVACGGGGWVQFWNVYGGGLIGEFNSIDLLRFKMDAKSRGLESITACAVDSSDTKMVLGNSLGYIQVYNIARYCLRVRHRPVTTPPPLTVSWKGHVRSVVSVDLAEDKALLVSASSDCSVRLWAMDGRFIGERETPSLSL